MAEIADLEFRIRQHTELHHQLRKSKGSEVLLHPEAEAAAAVATDTNPTMEVGGSSDTTTTPGNVNGYRGQLPGQYVSPTKGAKNSSMDSSHGLDGFMADVEFDLEGTASRTRPYQRTTFKKRKLVQTMNLHTISKKAARSR